MDIAPILGLLLDVARFDIQVLELEGQFVDGYHVLAGIVLQCPREECLREEEPRYPEALRRAIAYPVLQEVYAVVKILSP